MAGRNDAASSSAASSAAPNTSGAPAQPGAASDSALLHSSFQQNCSAHAMMLHPPHAAASTGVGGSNQAGVSYPSFSTVSAPDESRQPALPVPQLASLAHHMSMNSAMAYVNNMVANAGSFQQPYAGASQGGGAYHVGYPLNNMPLSMQPPRPQIIPITAFSSVPGGVAQYGTSTQQWGVSPGVMPRVPPAGDADSSTCGSGSCQPRSRSNPS